MDLKRQKFLVFGLSKSGMSAAKFLLSRGVDVSVYEELESDKIGENKSALLALGAKVLAKDDDKMKCDVLVLSPGVPINHPLAVEYKKRGRRVMGELELGALFVNLVGTENGIGKHENVVVLNLHYPRRYRRLLFLLAGNAEGEFAGDERRYGVAVAGQHAVLAVDRGYYKAFALALVKGTVGT